VGEVGEVGEDGVGVVWSWRPVDIMVAVRFMNIGNRSKSVTKSDRSSRAASGLRDGACS